MKRFRLFSLLPCFLLPLGLLIVPAGSTRAGTPYAAILGSPPVVTSLGWKVWYTRLLAYRVHECSSTRDTTYYFAPTGNDATGDGTQANPWQTIGKAQSVLASNVCLAFQRGGIYRSATGLSVTVPHTTIKDWGSAADPKPILTNFQPPYSTSQWSLTPGTAHSRCWQLSEPNTVAWLREAEQVNTIYRKLGSVAQVDANPGSWWQDTNAHLLYVNPTGVSAVTVDPTSGGRVFEAVYASQAIGLDIAPTASVDDTLVHNIRFDGWTANVTDNQPGGVQAHVSGTDAVVFQGVDVYFSDRHNLCNTNSGSGGIVTFVQCKYGWTTSTAGNGASVVYAQTGGQEAIWDECESYGDMLPQGLTPYPNATYGGSPQFTHSDGFAGHLTSLFVAYGCWNRPGQWQAGLPSSNQIPVSWTDLADCRSFVVDETFNARETTPLDSTAPPSTAAAQWGTVGYGIGGSGTVNVNCHFHSRFVWDNYTEASHVFVSNSGLGYLINCTLEFDAGAAVGTHYGAARCMIDTGDGTLYNCRVHIRLNGSTTNTAYGSLVSANSPATGTTSVQMFNTIYSAEGVGGGIYSYFAPGLGNIPGNQINNAYSNASSAHKSGAEGYDNDPYYVECADLPFGNPLPGSALATHHNQLVGGKYRLEYDADWNPRPLYEPSIGPYEPIYTGVYIPKW